MQREHGLGQAGGVDFLEGSGEFGALHSGGLQLAKLVQGEVILLSHVLGGLPIPHALAQQRAV